MFEQQRHPILPFYYKCEAVSNLGTIEVLMNKHIANAIIVEELHFLISKQVFQPQLDSKAFQNSYRLCR